MIFESTISLGRQQTVKTHEVRSILQAGLLRLAIDQIVDPETLNDDLC